MIKECANHRLNFDREVQSFCNGDSLLRVAQALEIMHRMAPDNGSYGKMLAIYSNTCTEYSDRIRELEQAVKVARESAIMECFQIAKNKRLAAENKLDELFTHQHNEERYYNTRKELAEELEDEILALFDNNIG